MPVWSRKRALRGETNCAVRHGECRTGWDMGENQVKAATVASAAAELLPWPFGLHVAG